MKHYVVGFCYNEKDEVLLLKKRKPQWQFDQWNGIGGKIEQDETPLEAMVREFREETTLQPVRDYQGRFNWEHKATIIGFFGTLFVFAAPKLFSGFFDAMPSRNDNDEEFKWFHVNQLPGNMIYNLPWLIRFCDEQPLSGPIVIQEPM